VPVRVGDFRRRIACVFGLQLVVVAAAFLLGFYGLLPVVAVIALIVAATVLAWFATGREWRSVHWLARLAGHWQGHPQDIEALDPGQMPARIDADIAMLAQGLQGFASRLAGYNERERNFTRDASHELRSPLTVIKMSVDMLGEEAELSEFGVRSVRRIKRATREMEVLVEALLILAREGDAAAERERFVVNDVLRQEIDFARDMLAGRPIELLLDEPARFAIEGSSRAFSIQCWQLIRNACQQTEHGRVAVSVEPGAISVSSHAVALPVEGRPQRLRCADRHGFELAIAQRLSDRFGWPLELQAGADNHNIARIRFPHPLPAEEA